MELKLDDIGFLGLANFWLLALVSILAGLALLNERRKLILLGIKGSQLLTILIALALLTTGVAQLRPYLGFKEFKLFGASSDLLLLVDVSSSMLTKDLSAARLEVAKRKIHSLLNRVRKVRYGDRVGIVAFAGSAYLFCPLTSDYAAVELFSRSLAPELISAQGSDISQALEVAIKVIDESNAAHSSLIILSDGEDSDFNPDQIRSLIKERKLEINALAFGTLAGMPIEGSNANFIKDNNNQVIISKLNPDTLKSVVKIGSGSYLEAKISDDDIESLIKAKQPPLPDADSTNNLEQVTLRNYNELGPLLCAIALGLLTFCAWRKPRALFSLLLLIILSSGDFLATNAQASPAKGYQHYQAKEYEKSVEIFEQELKHDPDNYKLKLALGNSYYRLGRFKEAQKAYQEAQQLSKNGRESFESHFNHGNSLLSDNQAKLAVSEYEKALSIKPKDRATTHNLEIAKKILEQQQQQQQQNSNQDEKQEQEQNKSENSDSKEQNESGEQKPQQEQENQQRSNEQDNTEKNESDPKEQPSDHTQSEEGSEQEDPNLTKQQQDKPELDPNNKEPSDSEPKEPEKDPNDETNDKPNHTEHTEQRKILDSKELKQREAKAWLESLPDAPALLQLNKQRAARNLKQRW